MKMSSLMSRAHFFRTQRNKHLSMESTTTPTTTTRSPMRFVPPPPPPALVRSNTVASNCAECGTLFQTTVSARLADRCLTCGQRFLRTAPYAWLLPGAPTFTCELVDGQDVSATHVSHTTPGRGARNLGRFMQYVHGFATGG